MQKKLYTLAEVTEFILQGAKLVISADESLLDQLPAGNWIGGTIPYFMTEQGGSFSKDKLFVDDLSAYGLEVSFKAYDETDIQTITKSSFENGFTILILPAGSKVHESFSLNSMSYKDIFFKPITGYVSGFDLNLLGSATAKTYLGKAQMKYEDKGVAMHVKLPDDQFAKIEIFNLMEIDESSDVITFPETGFLQKSCMVNGKATNLAEYLSNLNYAAGLPLIANCQGALINRSIEKLDMDNKTVLFYAPVFSDEVYRLAKPVTNYHEEFQKRIEIYADENVIYSVLCVVYYMVGELENKKLPVSGSFTFGEVGYQLLNQTLVYLTLSNSH
ncbi:conserved hypothetical protein [Chloroherpeton thalassium ATCC 35110]|uniref:Uncharacterized protein n=1 Tax=Chloroherpeton thalassium (strain ATCC 35110 / GB-78) TaxID=517418 RepID=B3QSF0_CHLT3|nr:hypothetical protein [Chloroherpeton thalassium]ACF12541.1 conserved hypothetical protein [Chloroherpeton thalassium ATCC 35110]